MNNITISLVLLAGAAGLLFFRPVRVVFTTVAGGYLLGMIAVLAFIPLVVFVTTKSLVIAVLVASIGIFLVLSPIFPIPLKSKFFVGVVAISMGIGFAGMFLGQDFLTSLSGYRKAVIGDTARRMNLWEEQYEVYTLPEGTPLYKEVQPGKVEFTGKLKVPVYVRLLTEIIEGDNGIKYRRVLFPVIIDGRAQENVFDHRSGFRLVTLSYLGESAAKAKSEGSSEGFELQLPDKILGKGLGFWALVFGGAAVVLFLLKTLFSAKVELKTLIGFLIAAALFLALVYIVFIGVQTFYYDIMGRGPNVVAVAPTREIAGEETVLPIGLPQGGHVGQLALPVVGHDKIVITKMVFVKNISGGKVYLHFGKNSKGEAKIPTLVHGKPNLVQGMVGSTLGTNFVALTEGTEIKFPPGEERLIWFSTEDGRTGELMFGSRPDSFRYKSIKEAG